ncbi:MAG: DUF1616 domain-containing protein [Methanobacteriota archaeon]
MANPVQVVAGLLVVFFVPGYCLVNALFPRRNEFDSEIDLVYRITIGIGLSMALVILVNFGLNALGTNPDTGLGYIDAPYLWASLLALSGALFAVGWWRGAYRWTARLHPKLARLPPHDPRSMDMRRRTPAGKMKLDELGKKRVELQKRVEGLEAKERMNVGSRRDKYARLKREAVDEIEKVDAELESLAGGEGLEG